MKNSKAILHAKEIHVHELRIGCISLAAELDNFYIQSKDLQRQSHMGAGHIVEESEQFYSRCCTKFNGWSRLTDREYLERAEPLYRELKELEEELQSHLKIIRLTREVISFLINIESLPEMRPSTPAHGSPEIPCKRALLVGICYRHENGYEELEGSAKDVSRMRDFLIDRCAFLPQNIIILCDQVGTSKEYLPTKGNVLRALRDLVDIAQPRDTIFFLYSGHGWQVNGHRGHMKNTLLLMGYRIYDNGGTMNSIEGEQLHTLAIALPPKCRFIAVFDCSHSGNILDLKHVKSVEFEPEVNDEVISETAKSIYIANTRALYSTIAESMELLKPYVGINVQSSSEDKHVDAELIGKEEPYDIEEEILLIGTNYFDDEGEKMVEKDPSELPIIMSFSACSDDGDAFDDSRGGGLLTNAFIDSLSRNPQPSIRELLKDLTRASYRENKHRDRAHWPQPQFGSLCKVDDDELFFL